MPSSSGGRHRNPTAAECAAPVSPAGPESREEEVDWRAAVTAPERLAAPAATGLLSAESDADLDRLTALARAHRILTDHHWQGAELRELVDSQLAALAEAHDDRIDASGPPVFLAAAVAVPLALILHELGTNAVKYGALATPDGRVEVRWERTGDGGVTGLRLVWREHGAASVTRPERRGLGTVLVENGLGAGRGRMHFEREGVVCELDISLPPAGAGGGRADVAA